MHTVCTYMEYSNAGVHKAHSQADSSRSPLNRLRVTDRQTDGQTDRWTLHLVKSAYPHNAQITHDLTEILQTVMAVQMVLTGANMTIMKHTVSCLGVYSEQFS